MLNPKMSQFTVFVCGSRECGLVTKGRQLFTVVIHDCSPLIHDRILQRKPQVLVQFSRNRFIVQLIAVFFTEIQVIQSYLELTIKMTNRASTRRSIFLIFGSTTFILFCTGMKQNAAIDEQHLTLIQLISFHPFFLLFINRQQHASETIKMNAKFSPLFLLFINRQEHASDTIKMNARVFCLSMKLQTIVSNEFPCIIPGNLNGRVLSFVQMLKLY